MAKVQFKAKINTVREVSGEVAYTYVKVPAITRIHCDLPAFRSHPKFGVVANSDLFLASVQRNLPNRVRLNQIPENITIDTSGFLAEVTINL